MASYHDQYKGVMGKRQHLLSEGRLSVPHGPGSTVAILSPFLPDQVYDRRDNRRFYERQETALARHFKNKGHETQTRMGATVEDFRDVLGDTAVSSMVVAGWGNFTSISAPLSRKKGDERFALLNWLQLAEMADHLKTGPMVMMQCLRYPGSFNPPLFLGLATSHANIYGKQGEANYAANTGRRKVSLPGAITDSVNLAYKEIKSSYSYGPDQQPDTLSGPDVSTHGIAYNVARLARGAVRECTSLVYSSETSPPERTPEPLTTPNFNDYKPYFQDVDFGLSAEV